MSVLKFGPVNARRAVSVVGADGSVEPGGRNRVTTGLLVFDGFSENGLNANKWETSFSGAGATGTASLTSGSYTLTSGDPTVGNFAIRQSRMYCLLQAGRSQNVTITFVLGPRVSGGVQRVGYFDANDGMFLERDGTTGEVFFVIRTSTSGAPVDTRRTVQREWNVDPLDGTGPSGQVMDWASLQIMYIDVLLCGTVRFGFQLNGQRTVVHEFFNSNVNSAFVPFVASASLPVRFEVRNIAAGAGGTTMNSINAAVMTEAGDNRFVGIQCSISNATAQASYAGVTAPVFSTVDFLPVLVLRMRATNAVSTLQNRGNAVPLRCSIWSYGAHPIYVEVRVNATIVGGAYASVGNSSNLMDVNRTATSVTDGTGILIATFYVGGTSGTRPEVNETLLSVYPLSYRPLAAVGDTLCMAVRSVNANTCTNVFGSIEWIENY